MGRGVPGVWSTAGQVDAITGLAALPVLRTALWEALVEGDRLPLSVVVAEVSSRGPFEQPLALARRLTLAAAMAHGAFGSAIAVGRLGVRRVGVLNGRDPDLSTRAALLARMVDDLPGAVRVHPVAGSPEVADWLLRQLSLER
jgi:hypothetical protein